jgi:hypothetical protein
MAGTLPSSAHAAETNTKDASATALERIHFELIRIASLVHGPRQEQRSAELVLEIEVEFRPRNKKRQLDSPCARPRDETPRAQSESNCRLAHQRS